MKMLFGKLDNCLKLGLDIVKLSWHHWSFFYLSWFPSSHAVAWRALISTWCEQKQASSSKLSALLAWTVFLDWYANAIMRFNPCFHHRMLVVHLKVKERMRFNFLPQNNYLYVLWTHRPGIPQYLFKNYYFGKLENCLKLSLDTVKIFLTSLKLYCTWADFHLAIQLPGEPLSQHGEGKPGNKF